MKKTLILIFLVGAMIMVVAGGVSGGTADPGIQDRIAEQQRRIDQGIATGELTRHEADILQDNLNWIKAEEARLKADGRLTPGERARLHRALDRNSTMIYKKKHNPVRRLY